MPQRLYIATILFDHRKDVGLHRFSDSYHEGWVTKLYAGFKRNLTDPFNFALFTDRPRDLPDPIIQFPLEHSPITYGSCMEPYKLNEPMILVGLDTVIVGNCDILADYCTALGDRPVLTPRDPYQPERFCNGVQLVPHGRFDMYMAWAALGGTQCNDMDFIRKAERVEALDDKFPGLVLSYKVQVRQAQHDARGGATLPPGARIVYFHGSPKPHELEHAWIRKHF